LPLWIDWLVLIAPVRRSVKVLLVMEPLVVDTPLCVGPEW
jgi:hypothetical protein